MLVHDEIEMDPKTHFLIVEDEEDVAEVIKTGLEQLKFSGPITISDNFEEAKKISEIADYIISDWNLENFTGLDLLKYVRSHDKIKNIPFLMVTANDDVTEMLSATESGTSDYLVKPWCHNEFKDKVFSAWSVHSIKNSSTSNP